MKKTKKRFLALLLTLTMVLSMGMQTFAAGTDSESDIRTQDIQTETETGTEDNTADVPDGSEGQDTEEAATSEDDGAAVQSDESEPAVRSNVSDKPSDGQTSGQPFAAGTGGSQNFRIPAMVTLDDGTIVAAADARWNTSADAGGLDTIVSRSSDNGANWNYTFANYLGDNGNAYVKESATFIDPALATDGSTIYMLADLFPGGVALNSSNQKPEAAVAFDEQGRLKLAQSSSSDYSYYLGEFENGRARIFGADGNAVEDYTVDKYFNLYQGDVEVSNLFFSDSPYQVVKTSYLYLTKSTDKGATWSAPTLINVKADDEQFYGVGPGTGLVTSTGRIIFAAYSHNSDGILGLSSTEYTSVIYSDNGGQTWTRSEDMSDESSEATLVEADGKIYMFTRHGGYYVSEDYGATWSEKMTVSGISYDTGCQINAMTYSEKIDGKTAILLSAPSSNRTNGKIFVGLVENDGSISWKYTYSVNNGTYQYSCMAELEDGSVALLYENASAAIAYTDMAINDIAQGAQVGTGTTDPEDPEEPVKEPVYEDKALSVGETSEPYTVDGLIGEEGSFETADGVVAYEIKHNTETIPGETEVSEVTTLNPGEYIVGDGTHWLTLNGSNLGSTTDPAEATVWTVEISDQDNTFYSIQADERYLSRESSWGSYDLVTTTQFSSNTEWRWHSNSGFCYQGSYGIGYYYLRYSSNSWGLEREWSENNSNSQNGNPYTRTEHPDSEKNSTTITFTGKAEGDTTVVIDNYEFTIHVTDIPDGEFSNIGELTFVSETGNADYSLNQTISHLILTPGVFYDLALYADGEELGNGYTVSWESADTSIASVNNSGRITANRVGETTVTATVTDRDRNIVGRHIATVTVIDDGNGYSREVEFYVADVQNTTLYYVENGHTGDFDFIAVEEGTVIYGNPSGKWNMVYFAAPDEGYALTYLSAENNYGTTDWTSIRDNRLVDPANANFQNAYGDYYYNQVLRQAQETYGCDGCFWFTRDNSSGGTGDCRAYIIAISEKLPTVEKSVAEVNGEDYTENTAIHVGDTITFDVTVTRYDSTYGISYSNATLTDNLDRAYFQDTYYNRSTLDISDDLGSNRYQGATYTYYVDYEVQQEDLETLITNTVDLEYSYRAAYSQGEYGGTAEAQAEVSVLAFEPDDYIIDFGSPITVDFTDKTSYDFVSGTANFGTVHTNGKVVTYTPNAVLTEADTVHIVNTRGAVYTFTVYPATSVYYEEGFASYDGSWSGGSATTGNQTVSVANDEAADLYGYDNLYASANENSNNTVSVSSTKNDTATFTFNGTGLDIYALTTESSGSMSLWLYEGEGTDGTLLKLGYVDTANNWLDIDKNYYNTPVFSYKDLTAGTYTVKIIVNSGEISLDGFRVYHTQGDAYESVYAADQEDQALTAEVRDITIAGSTYNLADIDDWYKYGENIISAVYDASNNGSGAVILGAGNEVTADADMINNGPKNEIYLKSGQTIAMRLTASAYDKVAVGMRSLNGGTVSYEINNQQGSVSSTVDMYYEVQPNDGMIVIENKSNNVLALTKIKVTSPVYEASGASLFTMDADTMAFALQCIADVTETVETADAALTVNIVDANGNAVAETVLTANGTVGETHTFAAADIQAAAEGILPEGYELTGEAADVEVVYGESGTTKIQAGKVAVLNVTYKNWLGKTVGTAKIVSEPQTSSKSSYLFTWNDVRKQAPDGYVLINLLTFKNVSYGSEKSMSVTVF